MKDSKCIRAAAVAVALIAFHGSAYTQEITLPGTEVVATLGNAKDFAAIAGRATEATGLPVILVRKLDDERAVFAVDQTQLLEHLRKALIAKGANVEVLDGVGPKIMGRAPVPRLQVQFDQSRTPTLWATASTGGTKPGDWMQQAEKYAAFSKQLASITRIPVNSSAGMEKGCVLLFPAPEKYTEALKSGLSAATGSDVEAVRRVKAFGAPLSGRYPLEATKKGGSMPVRFVQE